MQSLTMKPLMLAALLGMGLSLAACGKQEEPTPLQKAEEGVKDALDMREHEELKDAAEDAEDAMEDMGDAAADAAEDAGEAMEDAAEATKEEAEEAKESMSN
jgi:hypothetical protein